MATGAPAVASLTRGSSRRHQVGSSGDGATEAQRRPTESASRGVGGWGHDRQLFPIGRGTGGRECGQWLPPVCRGAGGWGHGHRPSSVDGECAPIKNQNDLQTKGVHDCTNDVVQSTVLTRDAWYPPYRHCTHTTSRKEKAKVMDRYH
jgi:hypothetical protein